MRKEDKPDATKPDVRPAGQRPSKDTRLVATDEAVRMKMPKSEVLNQGAGSLASCWNVLQYEIHKQFPGRVVRDFSIKTVDDSVEMTAYLGKLEEDKNEDTTRNSDG